jgi:ferredoxin-NADP reductase
MQSPDGQPLPAALPGQYVVVRFQPVAGSPELFRSYSLSGALSTERYRISVKIEANGAAGTYLREHIRAGDALDVSSPRGSFILQSGERPVVLLSAGIGATPVLAMLCALAAARLDLTQGFSMTKAERIHTEYNQQLSLPCCLRCLGLLGASHQPSCSTTQTWLQIWLRLKEYIQNITNN